MNIGWEWYLMGFSILAGLILLTVMLAIKKPSASWGAPFVFLGKYFPSPKKLITWGLLVGVVYGFYLLAIWLWPTPEQLTFKEMSRNLAELELKPDKDKLASLNEKVKEGKTLTENEKRVAMTAEEKIRSVRKEYSEGKLISPPPKPVPPKPTTWIFQIKADPEVIIAAKGKGVNQASLKEFNLTYFSKTDKELKFKYKTSTGKLVDALLDKKKPDDIHYFGMADLPDPPKGRKMMLWLKNDGEGFEGTTTTWDGIRWYPTVSAFLKKS